MPATGPDASSRQRALGEILNRLGSPPEAADRLQALVDRVVVVKYGGAAMVAADVAGSFARDVVLMNAAGLHPVVVHGGGPALTEVMGRMGLESTFVEGHRVTSAEAAEIAEMVLSGGVNKKVVSLVQRAGGRAVGLSGTDAGLVQVARHRPNGADVGFVGSVDSVDVGLLTLLLANRYIPVVSSTAADLDGQPHNINADLMAGSLAGALRAERLVVVTDVAGVVIDGAVQWSLAAEQAEAALESGAVTGGTPAARLQARIRSPRPT